MWSSRIILAAAALAVLGGCGFEPLYGGREGRLVREDLSQVEIAPIEDRTGQILRNELSTLMHPRGGAAVQPYRLAVTVTERKSDILTSKSGFSTRTNYIATATYRLDGGDGPTLLSDTATLTSSYNVTRSDFATVVAEQDARQRVLHDLAKTIANRVSVYFRQMREGPRAP